MNSEDKSHLKIAPMSEDDYRRIGAILRAAANHGNVIWGASSYLDIWVTEHRIRAEKEASDRLTRATWVLAAMTLALFLATVALVFVTIAQ